MRKLSYVVCAGIICVSAFLFGYWHSQQPRFTLKRFEGIELGISRESVEKLLGAPHRTAMNGDRWIYCREPSYHVFFKDDVVVEKEINPY